MAEAPRQRRTPRASAARPITPALTLCAGALIAAVPIVALSLSLRAPHRAHDDPAAALTLVAHQPDATNSVTGSGSGEGAKADADAEQAAEPGLEEGVVILRSGRIVQGLIVRRDRREIVLRVDGVDVGFQVREIESLQVLPPVEERYQLMREAIPPGDTDAMYALAEWLRARGRYQDALNELQPVLELEPFNSRARELQRWLEAQIALNARRAEVVPDADPPPRVERRRPRVRTMPPRFPTLTPEQINVMRVYEVDLDDPPRMRVDREAVRELLREYADDPRVPATRTEREALLSAPASQVLELMFDLRAREYYPRVRVLENPEAIDRFKRRVHGAGGWLTNACSTSRCHGGAHAGRLFLSNTRTNTDATALTNLLILDRFELADGTPLINYDRPARSPLLHMALPREDALYPHPEVPGRGGPGWRPVFRSTQDRGFVRAVGWIGSMYTPRLGYPIDYAPPAPPPLEPAEPHTEPDAEPENQSSDRPPTGTTQTAPGRAPDPAGAAPGT